MSKNERKTNGQTGMRSFVQVGNSGVGKTSLRIRFTDDVFRSASTFGIDFKEKTVDVGGKKLKLQIWDTFGQERFRTISTTYYKCVYGIIPVFDTTNAKSFENMSRLMTRNCCVSFARIYTCHSGSLGITILSL